MVRDKVSKREAKEKERIKKREERNEKRLKKLKNQKIYIKTLIGVLSVLVLVGGTFVYKGSHKDGISWDDIEKRQLEELEQVEGHLGGEELLITEKYKNEISKEEFHKKLEDGEEFNVYFYTPYCPYCNALGEEIIGVLDKEDIEYVVVDVNRDVEFQDAVNLEVVPSVAKYKEGEQLGITGVESKDNLEKFLRGDEGDN